MTTVTFPRFDYVQRAQLLAYLNKNKWDFNISEPEEKYNPEFVAKIQESREQERNGQTVKIKTEDLWK